MTNNLVEILKNENYQKHINRIIALTLRLSYGWFDQENIDNEYFHEKAMGWLKGGEEYIIGGKISIIKTPDDKIIFYDDCWGNPDDNIITDPYSWVTFLGLNLEFSKTLLQLWCDNYLNKKKIEAKNMYFIKSSHNESVDYYWNRPSVIMLKSENDNDLKKETLRINKYMAEKFYEDEGDLIPKIKEILPNSVDFLGIVSSYEEYEDILQVCKTENVVVLNADGSADLSENGIKNLLMINDLPQSFVDLLEASKLEDY
jgi:hypothetical protein